jgi:hypothetical protein
MLTYKWDPDEPVIHRQPPPQNGSLGPHPADPHSTGPLPSPTESHGNGFPGPNAQQHVVPGHELWVYGGNGGYVASVSYFNF